MPNRAKKLQEIFRHDHQGRVKTISRGTSLGRRVPREPTLPGDLNRESLEGTGARTSTRGGERDTKSVSLGIVKIPNSAPGSAIFEAQKKGRLEVQKFATRRAT